MNELERWISESSWVGEPHVIMNLLQSEGIISDECVEAKDVCDGDVEKAVAWLEATR